MIGVAPEALRAYCHAHALPYAVDPTNARTNLRRNAVREALTALRPLFPGLDAAVARAAEVVAEERDGSRRRSCARPCGSNFRLKKIFGTFTSYTSRPRYAPSRPGEAAHFK